MGKMARRRRYALQPQRARPPSAFLLDIPRIYLLLTRRVCLHIVGILFPPSFFIFPSFHFLSVSSLAGRVFVVHC